MHGSVTLQEFFTSYQQRLGLQWLTPNRGEQTILSYFDENDRHYSLVGHLNFIHPHRIQLLGRSELTYLAELGKNSLHDALEQLFNGHSQLVIVADGQAAPPSLLSAAEQSDIPVCTSPLSSHQLASDIDYYLRGILGDTLVVHGVFMEVMGIGVLLTGESAIGKSELALELITRGHRLVADDAPAFRRHAPETLIGHCPKALEDFLEVRGLGVMNVRELFGDNALKPDMQLQLIVHLARVDVSKLQQLDRLKGTRRLRSLLDVAIPEVEIPVAPGRNLAVLVEAAARNQILYNRGYDASEEFIARQQRMINKPE
jgi:HPr kinase/phosphorylase